MIESEMLPPDLDQVDSGVHMGSGVPRRTNLQFEFHRFDRGVHVSIVVPGTQINAIEVLDIVCIVYTND